MKKLLTHLIKIILREQSHLETINRQTAELQQKYYALEKYVEKIKIDNKNLTEKNNQHSFNINKVHELIEDNEKLQILKDVLLKDGTVDFEKVSQLYSLCVSIKYPKAL